MNHQLAVDTRATERYMLGELDEESRSAFEEHYFSCHACAADVKAAAVFVDNAKAVLATLPAGAPQAKRRFSFFSWMPPVLIPVAMAACLAAGYLLPHPAPPAPGGLITALTIPAGVRGADGQGRVVEADRHASYFLLKLDVADDIGAPRLSWGVRTAHGRELRFETVREDQATLPLSAADFPAGSYEVILTSGAPGSPVIDRYPFTIRYR